MSPSRRDAVATALSLALHGSLIAYVAWTTTAPELDFEFQLPTEVEFGLTDAVEVSEGASRPEPAAEAAAAREPGEGEGPIAADAGVPADGGPPDAGRRRRRRDAGPSEPVASAGEGEASGDEGEGTGDRPGSGRGVAFLPAGSQIALRIDVARIRRSPFAADVRTLLAVLPDWQVLLDGSGIDPLDDLDRVLIASPNLQRDRLIVAGRATGDEGAIRRAAARLAIAAGQPIEWTRRQGVEVAPWHDRSDTERIIALLGPRHFLICRPEDLSRVLAVARNRAADEAPEGEAPVHPADALLSMEEGEGLSLEVEGARNFARASPRRGTNPLAVIPTELRLALTERPEDEVAARTTWTYEGETEAAEAGAYWNRMREGFARNIIASVLGVSGLLNRATLEPEGDHLDGSVDLRAAEMRQLLNLSRQMFLDRARARERAQQGAQDNPPPAEGQETAPAPGTPTAPPEPPTVPPSPY